MAKRKSSTATPSVEVSRIARLPKWAQKHIEELEMRVRRVEQTLPWTEPGMEWFTVLHPDIRAVNDRGKHRKLFVLGEDYANPICSIGPLDFVFIGRGKPNSDSSPVGSRSGLPFDTLRKMAESKRMEYGQYSNAPFYYHTHDCQGCKQECNGIKGDHIAQDAKDIVGCMNVKMQQLGGGE